MKFSTIKSVLLFVLLLSLGLTSVSDAQDWARKMFKEYNHDFGNVPMGEIPEFRFPIENIYKEDIRIRSVSSSCGCTIASATKNVLKMWEKGEIVCRFNSPAVGLGFKEATITVRFDRPFVGECQLTVKGTIVSGVSFTPPAIDFGQVTDMNLPIKTIRVSSKGNPNFRIADVKSTSSHIKVLGIREVGRRGGLVNYELSAQLKPSVPKGYAQGELFVVFEENANRPPNMPPILRQAPIKFNAKVVSAFQVAPEVMTIGPVKPGEEVKQKVFLTADHPFTVTDVRCHSQAFSVKADQKAKKVHIVEVTYTGEDKPGRHECELSFFANSSAVAVGKMKAIVEIIAR